MHAGASTKSKVVSFRCWQGSIETARPLRSTFTLIVINNIHHTTFTYLNHRIACTTVIIRKELLHENRRELRKAGFLKYGSSYLPCAHPSHPLESSPGTRVSLTPVPPYKAAQLAAVGGSFCLQYEYMNKSHHHPAVSSRQTATDDNQPDLVCWPLAHCSLASNHRRRRGP